MFEYQTLICQLMGLEVSNASLYDGGSAVAEAALMCLSVAQRAAKIVVAESVHPEHRAVLATYLQNLGTEVVTIPCRNGTTDLGRVGEAVDAQTAGVIVQHPNFFGCLEDVRSLAAVAHDAGALLVVSVDPISLGWLKRPGDLGADIVVGEGQSLGNPMQYGGPYLGIMACREEFVRRMPGRIAGETVDRQGRRCWVLTLQTREQHIRRDKATSNICTNQGLLALRASVYLALVGPHGLREVATQCLQKAHYAAGVICRGGRCQQAWTAPFFKEFVVRDGRGEVAQLLAEAEDAGILAGLPLGRWYGDLDDCFLVAVTEQRTREQIDQLASALGSSRGRAL
jgi:glycine dehydrogenase subunit 1